MENDDFVMICEVEVVCVSFIIDDDVIVYKIYRIFVWNWIDEVFVIFDLFKEDDDYK